MTNYESKEQLKEENIFGIDYSGSSHDGNYLSLVFLNNSTNVVKIQSAKDTFFIKPAQAFDSFHWPSTINDCYDPFKISIYEGQGRFSKYHISGQFFNRKFNTTDWCDFCEVHEGGEVDNKNKVSKNYKIQENIYKYSDVFKYDINLFLWRVKKFTWILWLKDYYTYDFTYQTCYLHSDYVTPKIVTFDLIYRDLHGGDSAEYLSKLIITISDYGNIYDTKNGMTSNMQSIRSESMTVISQKKFD